MRDEQLRDGGEPVLKAGAGASELSLPSANLPKITPEQYKLLASKTYLTAVEAAIYLGRPSVRALYKIVDTHRIPKCRCGRSLLFLRRDLDEFTQGSRRTSDPALTVVPRRHRS